MSLGPEWKYRITITEPDWNQVQNWCNEYIGVFDTDWYKLGIDPMAWINNGNTETVWYFKEEKNFILFKLRWQ